MMETRDRFALEIFKLLLNDATRLEATELGLVDPTRRDARHWPQRAVQLADALLEELAVKPFTEARERITAAVTYDWFGKRPPKVDCTWALRAAPKRIPGGDDSSPVRALHMVCEINEVAAIWVIDQLAVGNFFRVTADEAQKLLGYGFDVEPVTLQNTEG